ncbi:MAG TPA: hypothetical protein QGG93_03865 [Verrucomicrobiota bacterium]|nr:hypothetical protein [Verrucomicrobiota bacterium]
MDCRSISLNAQNRASNQTQGANQNPLGQAEEMGRTVPSEQRMNAWEIGFIDSGNRRVQIV